MFLGDSITLGNGNDAGAGYRQYLLLAHPTLRPVGSQTLNPPPLLPGKDHHEGHPGFTVDGVQAQLPAWYAATPADIVLMHLGTNNFSYPPATNALVMGINIDIIHAQNPNAIVLVALIIPPRSDVTLERSQWGPQIAAVAVEVPKHPNAFAVTMPVLDDTEFADGFHPQARGYQRMADAWSAALTAGMR